MHRAFLLCVARKTLRSDLLRQLIGVPVSGGNLGNAAEKWHQPGALASKVRHVGPLMIFFMQ
jgi:hypothetical protein